MRELKILCITFFVSKPPLTGGLIRTLYPLLELGKTGRYRFDIIYLDYSAESINEVKKYYGKYPGINNIYGAIKDQSVKADVLWPQGGSENGLPKYIQDSACESYRRLLTEVLLNNKYDLFLVDHSRMGWVLPLIKARYPDSLVVLNLHNVESTLFQRELNNTGDPVKKAFLEGQLKALKYWEQITYPRYNHCITISREEKKIFNKYAPSAGATYVPIGLDLELFNVSEDERASRIKTELLFVGHLGYYPNLQGLVWFIGKAWPQLKKWLPDIRLSLVGYGKPSNNLKLICEAHGVDFWGQQDDETLFFKKCGIFIVPIFIGAGARIKIVCAWAAGMPVVSTSIGAEGLSFVNGKNILISDTPVGFAGHIKSIVDSPEVAARLSFGARAAAEREYSLEESCKMMDVLFQQLAETKAGVWRSE